MKTQEPIPTYKLLASISYEEERDVMNSPQVTQRKQW